MEEVSRTRRDSTSTSRGVESACTAEPRDGEDRLQWRWYDIVLLHHNAFYFVTLVPAAASSLRESDAQSEWSRDMLRVDLETK